MIETHYKTTIVGVSFFITVGGWWLWNSFLSLAYSDNLSPYDVKSGFLEGFGKDPVWWLTLLLTWAVLLTVELIWKSVKRYSASGRKWPWRRNGPRPGGKNAEELDLELWQEMERDPAVREKLRRLANEDDEGDTDYDEMVMS